MHVQKTAAGIAFPIFAAGTIGAMPKDLPSALQFSGKTPKINHFKLIYGMTIGSRFLSARDKDELRESLIKDTLGFSTWLIFGGFVSKLTARAIGGKELINNPEAKEGAKHGILYGLNWLMKSSVKTFDELLLPGASEYMKDGKRLPFKELYKNADKSVKHKVLKAAGAQAAGYLFSGIVLGMGITKLNIYITKRINERRKAQNKMNSSISAPFKQQKLDTGYLEKAASASGIFSSFNQN